MSSKVAKASESIYGEKQPERIKRLASLLDEIRKTAQGEWKKQVQKNEVRRMKCEKPHDSSHFQICMGGIVAEFGEELSVNITELEAMLDRIRDTVKTAVDAM